MVSCRDVPGSKCNWEGRAESVDELMAKVREHARSAHGMADIPHDMLAKVKTMIRDV